MSRCWDAGVLVCWDVGMMVIGVLGCQDVGMLTCWNAGVLGSWNDEMLQSWDMRILRFQNAEELLLHPVPWFILSSKKTMTIVLFTDTSGSPKQCIKYILNKLLHI